LERPEIERRLIELGCIPLDKSHLIRVGFLDLFNGKDDIFKFLESQKENLSDDLKSLRRVITEWVNGKRDIHPGESATIYRFFIYPSWAENDGRRFIKWGSLKKRKITDDPKKVLYRSPQELILLDGGTSQWVSAAYLYHSLFGEAEKIESPSPKIKLTYDEVEKRRANKRWEPQYDETILQQEIAIIEMIKNGRTSWKPQHSEDYPLARVLGLISREGGEQLFSSASEHETNRFIEMEKVIADVDAGKEIVSTDHRPIMAGVARQLIQGRVVQIKYPKRVSKSFPLIQFRKFVDFCQKC